MSSLATRPRLRAPRQRRSQATLDRLLKAATSLLEDRNWAEVTVADLVREAKASVGAFYSRFPDKEALLDLLDERYAREMVGFTREVAARCEAQPNLGAAVRLLVRSLVRFHRERRGLLRALVLRARSLREPAWDDRTRRMNAGLPPLTRALQRHRASLRHPDPERACFFAFAFMFSALRDRVLFPESVQDPHPTADDELAEELSRTMLAYLGVEEAR